MLTFNFTVLLIAQVLPAFLHPVYVSMIFTVAASSESKENAPKAVAIPFASWRIRCVESLGKTILATT